MNLSSLIIVTRLNVVTSDRDDLMHTSLITFFIPFFLLIQVRSPTNAWYAARRSASLRTSSPTVASTPATSPSAARSADAPSNARSTSAAILKRNTPNTRRWWLDTRRVRAGRHPRPSAPRQHQSPFPRITGPRHYTAQVFPWWRYERTEICGLNPYSDILLL